MYNPDSPMYNPTKPNKHGINFYKNISLNSIQIIIYKKI